MRISEQTLLVLAREGDAEAKHALFWLHGLRPDGREFPGRPWWQAQHLDAEVHVNDGRIGAGWPGLGGALRWPVNLNVYQMGIGPGGW